MTHDLTGKCNDGRVVALKHTKGGDWDIYVAGVVWGHVWREQHGQRGSSYTFNQIGHGQVYLKARDNSRFRPSQTKPQPAKVWGDKIERHRTHNGEPAPLKERLVDYTIKLIHDGVLRHPGVVEQEKADAAKAAQARAQEQNAAREQVFRDRAMQVLQTVLPLLAEDKPDEACAVVVEAMRWAQVQ